MQELVADDAIKSALHLVARVDVMPGEIRIGLDPDALATALKTDREVLCEEALQHSFPFRLRKRGVETKLILADSPAGVDEKLIRNIARPIAGSSRSGRAGPSPRLLKQKVPQSGASSR